MPVNVATSLQITIIAMGLVFAALILLWGIMEVLVRLTRQSEKLTQQSQTVEQSSRQKHLAAAAAVALALSEREQVLHEFPLPAPRIVSAWQVVMRTNMLNKRGLNR